MIHFDEHIFQMGGNQQLVQMYLCVLFYTHVGATRIDPNVWYIIGKNLLVDVVDEFFLVNIPNIP